ncbi:dystroglycan-like [Dorcoceras hygrometricum]|uniref:Dystroglycan-like n=1 Tax=Dorcoceras hygrometricum TaxID=472368 RepID=A0A2Z7BTK4_9LAMI|nr:dystroglycan-like [Dorcoceras hygrometricum]
MASTLYSNAQHVDFESVLGMDDPGMVSMFEALMASGLRGFLGCPAIVYEDALVDFFENASVRNGVVFSTVGGQIVQISEKLFAETFELPVVGLGDLSEMPKDAIFDARSIVSLSGEPINLSGRKNQMKMPFRLLCDIVAKAISVKAGSFNAITVEKFSLMTVVVCGVKINWAKFLFGVLKKMFSAKSKQAKGFAIQISRLLVTFPTVELGEASEFPASKILSKKTVLRFVSTSGLRGFLGCHAIVYEDALVDFFENASTFELPVVGLGDLSEMPKDAIFDARSIVSLSGEPINLSGRKNQMKMPFRLLCDIVAKAISVKAGSFNAITVEKFSLMTAVVCGVKMNWAKFLFGVLKKMVSAHSKQAKVFAIQISVLLATFPTVELGEASEFPSSKILSKKTVLRFVSINDRDSAEEVTGAAKKKVVSKKRTAADVEAAVPKKKRTVKKKSVSSISSLEMVAVAEEAVPIQQVAESLDVEEPRCSSADVVDLIIQQVLDETRAADAPADITEPAVTEEKHWFDLPYDDIVKQWEAERPVVMASDTEDEDIATVDVAPADEVQQVQDFEAPISAVETVSADELTSLDDILLSIPVDIPLPSTCMDVTKIKMGQAVKIPGVTKWTWFLKHLPRIPADDKGKAVLVEKDPVKGNPAKEHYSLICADIDLLLSGSVSSFAPNQPTVFAVRVSQFCSVFVNMSLFSWLPSTDISEFLSSIALDKTVLRSFQSSQDSFSVAPRVQLALQQQQSSSSSSSSSSSLRFDATDIDATASSRPTISPDLSAMFADFQVTLSEQLFESQSNIYSKLHKIEQNVRDSLSDQATVFKSLYQEAHQENRTLDDVQTIRFNEFPKKVLEQNASIFVGLADVRKEVQDVNAKVDIMAKCLTDIQKDAEATKEALSHQLFEFHSQAQENHSVIHAQLSELVDYIHRGRADKKGEISGSRGPQQPAGTQITGSAVTPTFEQSVQMTQRRIVQTVLDADANRAMSQEAA